MIFKEVLDDPIINELEKDYNKAYNDLHTDKESIIAWIKVITTHLIHVDYDLMKQKHDYDIQFNKLCLSKEYEIQYKTIKARELRATVELMEVYEDIITLKTLKKIYESDLEILKHELKMLETEL